MIATDGPNTLKDAKRVFIVDDHPLVRWGISDLLAQEKDLTVCGEAADVKQALQGIKKTKPDIALVDLSLKHGNGLDLIRKLVKLYPDLPTLVLSAHEALRYAERAMMAGARGYVEKEMNSDLILKAIHQVLSGKVYLSEDMMPHLLARFLNSPTSVGNRPEEMLSHRELQVFELIGQGMKTSIIANTLDLSTKTIQVYRENIKKKMKLKDSTELHQSAFEWIRREERI